MVCLRVGSKTNLKGLEQRLIEDMLVKEWRHWLVVITFVVHYINKWETSMSYFMMLWSIVYFFKRENRCTCSFLTSFVGNNRSQRNLLCFDSSTKKEMDLAKVCVEIVAHKDFSRKTDVQCTLKSPQTICL